MAWEFTVNWSWVIYVVIMQVESVALNLMLIMHEQAFGDYLIYHSFLFLESVGGEHASPI